MLVISGDEQMTSQSPHVCDVEAGVVVAVPGHAEHQFAGGDVQLQVLADPGQRLVQRRVSSAVAAHGDVRTGAEVWTTLVLAVSQKRRTRK